MHILVIDDDRALTDQLKSILEQERFEIYSAYPGNGAIQAAKNTNPDVIILDLAVPETEGWKTCRALRGVSQKPILVLSALNNPGLLTKALDEGADDFLVRPVQNGVLVAHVRTLARRALAESKAAAEKNGQADLSLPL